MKKLLLNHPKLDTISQYATVGPIIIMSILTLLALCTSGYIQCSIQRGEVLSGRSNVYYQAYTALNQEELKLHDYSLDHSAHNWQDTQTETKKVTDAFQRIQQMDIAEDRTFTSNYLPNTTNILLTFSNCIARRT